MKNRTWDIKEEDMTAILWNRKVEFISQTAMVIPRVNIFLH
jgi:hypothetical protein